MTWNFAISNGSTLIEHLHNTIFPLLCTVLLRLAKATREARYASILCNRFLLEEGLLKLYPKLSLTEGYKKFSPNLLKAQKKGRPTMTPSAKQILQNLTQVSRHAAQQRDVVKDLQDLVHELSKAPSSARFAENQLSCDVSCHLRTVTWCLNPNPKDIHYPELKRTGFLCGGKQPLGAAVAVALCELQVGKMPGKCDR